RLGFRVYRVKDPVQFFSKLDSPHEFGTRIARPQIGKRSPLERFHTFKVRARRWARNFLRAQFTTDSRSEIRVAMAGRSTRKVTRKVGSTSFAGVPLLNPERLVTTWEQPVGTPNRWERQVIPVDVHEKGLYLVEATDGTLRAYTIALITDLAVLSKSAPGRVFAQVVNRRSGQPVHAKTVVLADGKQIASLETAPNGTIDLPVREQSVENVSVLATRGEDFAADALWGHNISSDDRLMGYVYTDRPVYRPGHNVSFRGIVRAQGSAGYVLPSVRELDVEVTDSEGNAVYRKRHTLSTFGTLEGEFTLGAGASLGYYGIHVRSGESGAYGGFQVEEYKKPEYEVKVTPEMRRVIQGESVPVTIEARYYFGEAVANGTVNWTVHRSRYWSPFFGEEMDEEEPGEYGEEARSYGSEEVSQGSGKLDPDGRLRITVPTEPAENDMRYRVEARVTDSGNREINGSGAVLATVGPYVLNVQPTQYVYQQGDTASVEVQARDYDGNPVDAGVELTVAEWRWGKQPKGHEIYTSSSRTGPGGKATFRPRFSDGGSYRAVAVSRTADGREIRDMAYIWVAGDGGLWAGEQGERLQIIADKKSYKPGETANILIVTGVPEARVVVSVEGRQIYSAEVVHAKSPSVSVSVPIRSEYQPDVYVTAAFIRDNRLFQGAKRLKVPPDEKRLAVDLTSSKPQYKPGEPAVFSIAARDHNGSPVAAEFSLGVVDEAIYAIRREMAQDILKFFYGFGYNRVNTGSSLRYYFWGQAGKRTMQLAQVRQRNLAQLKPERLVDPAVRKAFPDTAFWAAGLRTNAQGQVQARFSFPDSLTTWRATARGVTTDTRVGSAIHKVIVRKNLILRLSTPRFLTQGDEVIVSALVHNYLESTKNVRVSLDVDGADILEGATQDVSVASKAAAKVDWRLRANPGAKVTLLGKALTDEESDAMEIALPVQPFGVKMSDSRSGTLPDATAHGGARLTFPADATPGSRSLEVSVTPSLAGALFGALDYLTSFPYGCVEQTMSSFLPNVVVAQAAKQLGLKTDDAALAKKIRAGLERLADFQHEDGGWGWWKTDESDGFMTAYVVAGLAQARAAGVSVNAHSLDRGAGWLIQNYAQLKSPEADLRAYIVYALALAGKSNPELLEDAAGRRSGMTAYGLAVLGLAFHEVKDQRAAQIAATLETSASQGGEEAWWPVDRDTLMRFHGSTTPEATAYAVKLLAAVKPESPLLPRAAAWLVHHRSEGYYWASTKQTAMVIYGLTDYVKASGELKPDFAVTVRVNGREVLSRRFTAADAFAPQPPVVRLSEAELAPGMNEVAVSKNGTGKLYWSARAEYHRPATQAISRSDLSITREYFRLTPQREDGRITYDLAPLDRALAPGDTVAVKLTLNAPDEKYLMIEDPIPAGAEFIERDDLYEIKGKPPWWRWWFTRREFHDNRAALFQTWGSSKPIEYFYLLKIVNPGVFKVSPGRAGPMYQPERFATTEPKVVEVSQ
ncbi:MAG TPA: MG2 domain-containing protein, partial [Bryobacteraceae bacterium]|nr:MG2 domain-containing protein [Bryobacteraceae bacterium]